MEQPKAKTAKKDNGFKKGMLIGGAVGLAAGGVGGYFVARKKLLKKARQDVKRAYKHGYDKGVDETFKEAQEVIDELNSQTIVVDSDSVEDIQKALKEREEKLEKTVQEHELLKKNIKELYENGHSKKEIAERLAIPYGRVINLCKEIGLDKETECEVISDPAQASKTLDDAYEQAMGVPQSPEDMDDWDLSIEGEEAMKRSEERERYLDAMENYKHHPEDGPMHISRKAFEEECYLTKVHVTYYAGDNVFADDLDADQPMDAFNNFGVVNGNDLFTTRVIEDDDNDDPNVTYVRNFKQNAVFEITRMQRTYQSLKTGEAFLDGPTTSVTGDREC